MAEASKDAGNRAFKAQDYPLALAHYSTAMQVDPSSFTYPLNRSLVYLKQAKWKEAEKDATTALKLQPGTTKAYFRRGLARKGAGELEGAKEDFEAAKKCGAGEEVDKELRELAKAAPSSKLKDSVSASSSSAPTTSSPALSNGTVSAPKPSDSRTDRLRAALSTPTPPSPTSLVSSTPTPRPSDSPAKAAASTSAAPPVEPKSVSGLMQAVSTRRLAKSAAPIASPPQNGASTNPFATKKKEREEKSRSFASAGSATTTVSKVEEAQARGNDEPVKEQVKHEVPPSPAPIAVPPLPAVSMNAPTTAAAFEHAFLTNRNPEARSQLLKSLPPTELPRLFGSSLTPDLLSDIIATLTHSSSAKTGSTDLALLEWQLPFLRALTGVNRFGTVVGFMDDTEKAGIRSILDRGREALEKLGSDWEV